MKLGNELLKNELTYKHAQLGQRRIEWLKALAQPGAKRLSKTELYAWLYRNDKEWLQKNPPVARRSECRSRVNWFFHSHRIDAE